MIRCYPIQLPVFEGPLDLLLQLIEREELDITAISLAQVTDQYLAIVEEMGRRSLADLTAFLVVAAKLVLIKSRVLLPGYRPRGSEEDEVAADLIRQLEMYRLYRVIAGGTGAIGGAGLAGLRASSAARRGPCEKRGPLCHSGRCNTGRPVAGCARGIADISGPSQ